MPLDLAPVRARFPGRRIDWFPTVGSTMTLAADAARQGCASGTVIGADQQTAGIGRHGHSWHSEPEAGLYTSIVLRVPVGGNALPVLMLALGLATQHAIAEVAGLAADLRWPNDVLIGGKKCAGMLAVLEGGAVITGIGINVNHSSFPPDIAPLATSLRLEGGLEVSREGLLIALLQSVDDFMAILVKQGTPAILDLFTQASSYARGRRVRVEQNGEIMEGITCGLDSSGFLLVRGDNGKETTILAGGVRPV
jgi:BirA family biotin operon repressor/biotin-[acetyl-CoA-carboxylase] ligase